MQNQGKFEDFLKAFPSFVKASLPLSLRQGVSYSDDFSLTVLTKFCTSNSNSKIF